MPRAAGVARSGGGGAHSDELSLEHTLTVSDLCSPLRGDGDAQDVKQGGEWTFLFVQIARPARSA
eukprot:1740284-Rhodomonas_salina.3